jgi:glycosyltransferase involved in cell wall biosynthesis
LYLDTKYISYLGDGEDIITTPGELETFHPDVAILYNIGMEDMGFVRCCRKIHCKIGYVLHEPDKGVKDILKYLLDSRGKNVAIYLVNNWICDHSDKIILCSDYAEESCHKYMKRLAPKITRIPLIFLDDYDNGTHYKREYFSLLGSYETIHGSDRFLDFVKESDRKNDFKFQIVTRSSILKELDDPVLRRMQEQGRLIVQQGRPLTEAEMNEAYRKSIAVWNGYRRSTQSGVLANAYMQGTPVVATHLGSFDEFVLEGRTGCFIPDLEYDSVMSAIEKIKNSGERMNEECRNFFRQTFCYENQKDTFQKIVEDVRGEG